MFKGEEKDRIVVEKVIEATKVGKIQWQSSEVDFNQRFYADWKGWKLTATWFQDETSFEMFREGKTPFRTSYRVMGGLRDAIATQVDPDHKARLEKEVVERQKLSDRLAKARDATRKEILNELD